MTPDPPELPLNVDQRWQEKVLFQADRLPVRGRDDVRGGARTAGMTQVVVTGGRFRPPRRAATSAIVSCRRT